MKTPDKPTTTQKVNGNDAGASSPGGGSGNNGASDVRDIAALNKTRSENDIVKPNSDGEVTRSQISAAFNNTENENYISAFDFAGKEDSNATSNNTRVENSIAASSNTGSEEIMAGDIHESRVRQIQNPDTTISLTKVLDQCIAVPEKLVHKWDSKVLVYNRFSPLSTLYPTPFIVNGQTYINRMQYLDIRHFCCRKITMRLKKSSKQQILMK